MKIAFPTNDKENIFKRSGRAKGFLVVDIAKEPFKVVDYRVNTHKHDHGEHDDEHHGHSHKEIVDALNDCEALVVNVVGKHFGKDIKDAGIKVFKTDKMLISEAIKDFKTDK